MSTVTPNGTDGGAQAAEAAAASLAASAASPSLATQRQQQIQLEQQQQQQQQALSASAANLAIGQQNSLLVALIHEAEALSTQARRLGGAGADRARKLERAWSKLEQAQQELAKQAQGCAQVVEQMAQRCAQLDLHADALGQDFAARQAELQAVLDGLGAHPLAACLQPARSPSPAVDPASNGSMTAPSSQALQTLFDFVDADSLGQVRAHFLRSMERLAQLGESARGLLSRAETQLGEARTLEAQLIDRMQHEPALAFPVLPPLPLAAASALPAGSGSAAATATAATALPEGVDGSVLMQSRAALTVLDNEVAQMAPLFSAMCGAYDRVRQARQAQMQAAQAAASAGNSMTALSASTTTDVAAEISSMQIALQQLQAHAARAGTLSAHLESCSAAHSALYAHTLLLFNALQSLSPSLNSALASFSTLELECDGVVSAANSGVVELRNLTGFYLEFERAYEALLAEIQRRHRQMAHQQAMMHSFKQALDEAFASEQAERDAFANAHGRFLPPSLCPAINESVIPVRLMPEELETALPVWVPTPAEQARQEAMLHERHQQALAAQQAAPAASAGGALQSQHHPSNMHGSEGALDGSGNAAQVTPALSASSHQQQLQHQQHLQQQQPQQPEPQLDSLQHVLSQQYGRLSLRGDGAQQPLHQGGLAQPTPLSAQQQHWQQQLAAAALPPSSQLAHSATQPVEMGHAGKTFEQLQQPAQQGQSQQLNAAAPSVASRTASQPARSVASYPRSFDDD